MSDRRRTQRFVLGPPLPAEVTSMQDVVVERMDAHTVTIVSLTPQEPSQPVLIHLTMADGPKSHRMTVLSSTPIAVGASVQFRVELQVHTAADEVFS